MFPSSGRSRRVGSVGPWSKLVWAALLAIALPPNSAFAAQGSESEAAMSMSEDVRQMHERLVSLSQGEGRVSSLRIEFMDGSGMSHRSFDISFDLGVDLNVGTLVSKEWKSPGAAMIHREGSVADSRVRGLLQELIAKRYWSFEGTQFIPDAPIFLFRFYYAELHYVDFRCDVHDVRESETRTAIRDLFLQFVSETEMSTVPAKP